MELPDFEKLEEKITLEEVSTAIEDLIDETKPKVETLFVISYFDPDDELTYLIDIVDDEQIAYEIKHNFQDIHCVIVDVIHHYYSLDKHAPDAITLTSLVKRLALKKFIKVSKKDWNK